MDIDYGTTGNNAATANMHGTAAVISDLSIVLDQDSLDKAVALNEALVRIGDLRRLRELSYAA